MGIMSDFFATIVATKGSAFGIRRLLKKAGENFDKKKIYIYNLCSCVLDRPQWVPKQQKFFALALGITFKTFFKSFEGFAQRQGDFFKSPPESVLCRKVY